MCNITNEISIKGDYSLIKANLEDIKNLIESYDFYHKLIDNFLLLKKVENNNNKIIYSLIKLGVDTIEFQHNKNETIYLSLKNLYLFEGIKNV